MKKLILAVLLCFGGIVFASNSNFSPGANLAFYPNVGQYLNDLGQSATNVHYRASVSGMDLYLTDQGLTYVFVRHNHDEYDPALGGHPTPNFQTTMDFGRVDMELVGANLSTQNVVREGATEDFINYYYAHCADGREGVQGYYRLTYRDVYPGIDWVIFSKDGQQLKYEFVVHPGADPSDILIRYHFADVEVQANGLTLTTPRGQISEQGLYAYIQETGEEMPADFVSVDEHAVRVNTQMPSTGTLVIDPPLVWATYLGSSGDEQPQALVTGNGFVIVAGYCNTTVFPTLNPGGGAYFQGTIGGSHDAWMVKFDTSGVRIWSTYYGGSSDEGSTSYTGVSVATAQNTALWLVGTTLSSNLPVLNGGGGAYYQGTSGGSDDFFVAKFNLNTGVRQHATYFGGSGSDGGSSHGNGADCDANGNLFFSGRTVSTNFPLMNPGGGAYYDATQNGSDDLCIVKLSPNGNLLWSTLIGGSGDDMNYSMDLHVDRVNSRLYLGTCSGSTNAPTMTLAGAFNDATNNGGTDAYIARFTLNGVMQWATYYGGSSDEWLSMSLSTAPDGDLAMMTLTGSTNIPMVTPGGPAWHDNTHNGGTWDMFVTRFQSNMSLYWNTFYGSSNNDHCQHNLTVDYGGRIIIVGVSDGTASPVTFNPGVGHYYNGVKDAQGTYCIVQYDTTCAMIWGTYYGGSGHDHLFGTVGGCIGVSEHSDIFVSAETNSTNLTLVNPGGGAYFQNTNAGGGKEGFVLKFNNDINVVILDIALSNLTGEQVSSGNLLRWEVGANSSARSFEIEHEQNGVFQAIGVVDADGSTRYSFTDLSPLAGVNRYRLRITDQNGFFTYSNVVEIRDAAAGIFVETWPNPTNDILNLRVATDGQRTWNLQITDLTGRLVLEQSHQESGIWSLDLSTWAAGSYILNIRDAKTGEKIASKNLVVN